MSRHHRVRRVDARLSHVHRVLLGIPSNCGSFRSSGPLSLRHTFFQDSGEVGSNVLTTLVDLRVDHSVRVVGLAISILVHHYLRRVRVLLLQLVEPFIILYVFLNLLFNPLMGVLIESALGIPGSAGG